MTNFDDKPILKPILALDTSVPTARVAILDRDGRVLASAEKTAARHSSNLLGLCDECLHTARLTLDGLGAIACGAGPGSFTGLRVGMAAAKGLALSREIPFVLVPSLDALLMDLGGVTGEGLFVPCIDAGKDQVYARLYRGRVGHFAPLGEHDAFDPRTLCQQLLAARAKGERIVIGGSGVDRYRDLFVDALGPDAVCHNVAGPSATSVGTLALRRLASGHSDDLDTAVPTYGRLPDITAKRPRKPQG